MNIAILYPPIKNNNKYPLLTQNRQFRYSSSGIVKIFPVVMASAATLLKHHGFGVLWLDAINRRLSMEAFFQQLESFSADVVVMESKTPIIEKHGQFAHVLKEKNNKIKILFVGDHVSVFAEETLRNYEAIDFIVSGGDYDAGIVQVCRHLKDTSPLPKGVWYRENNTIKNTGAFELINNLDELPLIDRDLTRWRDYGEAYLYTPCAYIMSGRGCGGVGNARGSCTFCIWQQALWRTSTRLRSPANVASEIELLVKKYKVREIFDDNESGAIWNRDWLENFYEELKKRKLLGTVALSSNARADSLDTKRCRLLKKMGFRLLKIGLESANNKTLARLDKKERIEQIIEGIRNAKESGLRVLMTIMTGYPWETEDDVKHTYATVKELMLYKTHIGDSLQASFIIPYPKTALYQEAIQNDWFVIDPGDYASYDMSHPVLTSDVDPVRWCGKMWGIHTNPLFLLKSFFSIRSFNDIQLVCNGIRSLKGHLKDFAK